MTQEEMDILKAYYSRPTTDKVQPNFEDVKTVADNITKVVEVSNSILNNILTNVHNNIDDIKTNASQSEEITTLANISVQLSSLFADKDKLSSIYADKTTLDALYSIKSKLDSIYADKDKLNSLYADKTTLDTLYLNIEKLNSVFDNLTVIQNAEENANNAKLDKWRTESYKLACLSYAIQPEDEYVKIYTSNGDGTFTITDTTEYSALHYKNKAQSIAGGTVLAENVEISSSETLENFATSINLSISSLQNILNVSQTDLDTAQERVNYILNLESELEAITVSDILGLQTALDERANLNTGNTFTGNQTVNGEVKVSDSIAVYDNNNSIDVPLIVKPKGGTYKAIANQTGYIKIKMPVSWTSTMVIFEVIVFNYETNKSVKFFISGYNYIPTTNWLNTTAIQIDNNENTKYNVRFGHDGDTCCIWIGESDTIWKNPQVVVANLNIGFKTDFVNDWKNNWQISFTTTLGTVTQTLQAGLDASTLEGLNSENILTNTSEYAVGRELLCTLFNHSAIGPLQTVSGAYLSPLLLDSRGVPQETEMIDQSSLPGVWKNIHPNRAIYDYDYYATGQVSIGYFRREY